MPEDLSNLPYVERKIREAIARGEFDNLPGTGKPLPDLNDDPNWWVKKWVERERIRDARREARLDRRRCAGSTPEADRGGHSPRR